MKHKSDSGPKVCSVMGCDKETKRSLSAKKVKSALSKKEWKPDVRKRAGLCKDHYKEFKKATKEERLTDRLGWE